MWRNAHLMIFLLRVDFNRTGGTHAVSPESYLKNNFHLMQEFNSSSTTTGNNSIAANFTRGITDMYVKEVSGPHGCQDNFDFLKILHLPHKLMQFV